jgi:peptidoglycan hydrolase CwlO-like protein
MNPDEEDDDYSFDETNETDPVMRDLEIEMVRLQAQIDQLSASARERAEEIAELHVRLIALEQRVDALKMRYRKNVRLWIWIAAMYGVAAGMVFSYLMRP